MKHRSYKNNVLMLFKIERWMTHFGTEVVVWIWLFGRVVKNFYTDRFLNRKPLMYWSGFG